jgi:hypothetical protein
MGLERLSNIRGGEPQFIDFRMSQLGRESPLALRVRGSVISKGDAEKCMVGGGVRHIPVAEKVAMGFRDRPLTDFRDARSKVYISRSLYSGTPALRRPSRR